MKLVPGARFGAKGATPGGRELRSINPIENDTNVVPVEIVVQKGGGPPGNCGEGHLGVRINPALEPSQK